MSEPPAPEPPPRVSAWQIGLLPILILVTLISLYLAATRGWNAPVLFRAVYGLCAMLWLVYIVFRGSYLWKRYRRMRGRDRRHRQQLDAWVQEQRKGTPEP